MAEEQMQNLSFSPEDLAGQERKAKRQDQAAAFASWLNSMSIRPDPNLPAQLQAARAARVEDLRKNRTVNMLEQAGQTELANLVKAGTLDAKSAASQMFQMAAQERQFEQQKELLALKAPKKSVAETKVDGLVQTGVPREIATGIVYGRFKAVTDPVSGKTNLFDLASGSIISQDLPQAAIDATKDELPQDGAFEGLDPSASLGMSGWAKSVSNMVTDAIGLGQKFPKAGEAEAALENLQARITLMAGVDIAGKPSNFTRQEIKDKLTVSPSEFSTGPERALQKTRNTVRLLEETFEAAQLSANGGNNASVQQQKDAKATLPTLTGLLRDYRSLQDALEKSVGGSAPSGLVTVSPEQQSLINKYYQENMLPSPD
tara:strand:+ start:825 stop:1946 length:1122 start_codon:yes stop_codon:yes gene_type:complete